MIKLLLILYGTLMDIQSPPLHLHIWKNLLVIRYHQVLENWS